MSRIPAFSREDWYLDHRDSRCPHDAWLEAVEVSEPAEGARHERRRTSIKITLLGAFHDGHIVFRYAGVRAYSLTSPTCVRGLGDWLGDHFEESASGRLVHHVTWAGFGPGEESRWMIEADDVSYEWIPQKANQSPEPTSFTGR